MDPRFPLTLVIDCGVSSTTLPHLNAVTVERTNSGDIQITTDGRFAASQRQETLKADRVKAITVKCA